MKKFVFVFLLLGAIAPMMAQDAEPKVYEPLRVDGLTLGDVLNTNQKAVPGEELIIVDWSLKTPVLAFKNVGFGLDPETKEVEAITLLRQFGIKDGRERVEAALLRELQRRYGPYEEKDPVGNGLCRYTWHLKGPKFNYSVSMISFEETVIGLRYERVLFTQEEAIQAAEDAGIGKDKQGDGTFVGIRIGAPLSDYFKEVPEKGPDLLITSEREYLGFSQIKLSRQIIMKSNDVPRVASVDLTKVYELSDAGRAQAKAHLDAILKAMIGRFGGFLDVKEENGGKTYSFVEDIKPECVVPLNSVLPSDPTLSMDSLIISVKLEPDVEKQVIQVNVHAQTSNMLHLGAEGIREFMESQQK